MTPERARNIIHNFCIEYCDGQLHYQHNGKLISADDLTDAEAITAAEGCTKLMIQFATEEAKGATKQ
jgi:hypothetical protein